MQQKDHFDSANIAESYSGIVLPLTFSFAQDIYRRVYSDLLGASGVSREKIKRHAGIFDNLLGIFYGRIYYNMNNWYRMMAFLPGYRRNKMNLEQMITSNISGNIERDIFPSLWLKIKYPFLLLSKIMSFPFVIAQFKKRVSRQIKRARNMKINNLSLKQCQEFYRELDFKLLSNWYRTVENDFMVMTYFGFLKKKYPQETIREIIKFNSEGTKQIRALKEITEQIKNGHDPWKSIKTRDENLFRKSLLGDKLFAEELNKYFLKYGGRFANELKLESTDIESDFNKFADIIELYAQSSFVSHNKVEKSLRGSLISKLVLRKFKKYSAQREELRLLRSNAFAVVRKIFNQIGQIFFQQGLLKDKDDIFYLTTEEIFSLSQDEANKLVSIVGNRKKKYEEYKNINPPTNFSVQPGESPRLDYRKTKFFKKIQAKPCSAGKIKGKVKIFKDFGIPKVIDFDIIVASRTDPGWTTLMALCKGMIIEQGGVLSHAAIVSRELGIPTVIGATNATAILKDGQIVEIDGATGIINIINS